MKYFANIPGMLAFREQALRMQAERRATIAGIIMFCAGFLAYSIVRSSAYEALPEMARQLDPDASFLDSNLFQAGCRLIQWLLFLLIVYIPVLMFWSDFFGGDRLDLSNPKHKYQSHLSALFPLWGVLFIIAAPLQWLIPFVPIRLNAGISIKVDISFGMLVLLILLSSYTLWALKQLSRLSLAQSFGFIVLSWFALAVFFLFK